MDADKTIKEVVMPNWVTNRLTVTGPDAEQIVKENIDEHGELNFDLVCKCPEELADGYSPFKGSEEEKNKLVVKYGHDDWYGWCLANWGCKWSASDTIILAPTVIQFNTPWSMPIHYMEKLSEKYPENSFEIRYYDENIGANLGVAVFENGAFIGDYTPETNAELYDFFVELDAEETWLEHILYDAIEEVRDGD